MTDGSGSSHLERLRRFVRVPEELLAFRPSPGGLGVVTVLDLPGTPVVVRAPEPEPVAPLQTMLEPWIAPPGRVPGGVIARLTAVPVAPAHFLESPAIDWGEFLAVAHGQRHVLLAGFRWLMELCRDGREATLWFDGGASGAVLQDLWENALRCLAAYRILHEGGLLVHSAAVVLDGRGLLFPGSSGDGKSTVSSLCSRQGCGILSDDCNAVLPAAAGEGRAFEVAGLPFGGETRPRRCLPGTYPLAAVAVLEKSESTGVTPAPPAAVAARLVRAAPFVNGDPFLAGSVLVRASRIAGSAIPAVLSFARAGGVASALEAFLQSHRR